MNKTVTYRRVPNKLRTRNRDLSRHKRCQAFDRGFGNNGGVSSLGVDYLDSDGDGYKDKITKTRRAQSLYRDPYSYGGSQAVRGYYSRKISDSASPAAEREFKNVVIDGNPPRNKVLDKAFKDSGMYNGQGYWDTYLDVHESIYASQGIPYTTNDGYDVLLHGHDVTVNSAVVSITIVGKDGDGSTAAPSLRVILGSSEGLISGSAYDPDPAARDTAKTYAAAGTIPGTLIGWSGGAAHTSFTESAPYSAGSQFTRVFTGLSANTTYYYSFQIPNNDYTPDACTPLQRLTTLAS